MKKKDIINFKDKKVEELLKLIAEKKLEIERKSAEMKAMKQKNLKSVKFLKRDVAQLLTLVRNAGD